MSVIHDELELGKSLIFNFSTKYNKAYWLNSPLNKRNFASIRSIKISTYY
jgi:hypothetical protein